MSKKYRSTAHMNKAGIVEAVSAVLGGTKKSAEDAVEAVFETITKSLSKGEEVGITGFGVFMAKKRAARMGVNPRTGEKVHIGATTTPKFRAGKSLKDAVK